MLLGFLKLKLAIIALWLGLIVYVVFYPSSVLINKWAHPAIHHTFGTALPVANNLGLIFNLPALFWAFSFAFFLLKIPASSLGMLSGLICIFGYEIAQEGGIGLIGGTYDPLDLLASAIGVTCALVMALQPREPLALDL